MISPTLLLLALTGCAPPARSQVGGASTEAELLRLSALLAADGRAVLRVENVSSRALMLARGVEIEALELFGESHQAYELTEYGVEASDFFLVSSCDQPTRGCLTLDPGELVQTVPWSGYYAAPQCFRETPSDYEAPPGRYRFVVSACGGGARFFSPPFQQGAPERE